MFLEWNWVEFTGVYKGGEIWVQGSQVSSSDVFMSFLSAIWLPQGQLWATDVETASFTQS